MCICLCVCILHNKFYRTLHTNSFINLNFSVHLQCPSFLCSVHLDNVQKLLCMHNVLCLQTSFTNTVSSYGLVKATAYCEIIYDYRCFIFSVFMFNCLILCHFYKKEWRNVLAVAFGYEIDQMFVLIFSDDQENLRGMCIVVTSLGSCSQMVAWSVSVNYLAPFEIRILGVGERSSCLQHLCL